MTKLPFINGYKVRRKGVKVLPKRLKERYKYKHVPGYYNGQFERKGYGIVRNRIDELRHDITGKWSRDHMNVIRGEVLMLYHLEIITEDEDKMLRHEMLKARDEMVAERDSRPIPSSIELDINGNVVKENYN